jgi:hypothetical protein
MLSSSTGREVHTQTTPGAGEATVVVLPISGTGAVTDVGVVGGAINARDSAVGGLTQPITGDRVLTGINGYFMMTDGFSFDPEMPTLPGPAVDVVEPVQLLQPGPWGDVHHAGRHLLPGEHRALLGHGAVGPTHQPDAGDPGGPLREQVGAPGRPVRLLVSRPAAVLTSTAASRCGSM